MSDNPYKLKVIIHMPNDKDCMCPKCLKWRTEWDALGLTSDLFESDMSSSSDGNPTIDDLLVPPPIVSKIGESASFPGMYWDFL
jgi:hypothetical protein